MAPTTDLELDASGARGSSGASGANGSDGFFGGRGASGGDAGPAEPGEPGGQVRIALSHHAGLVHVAGVAAPRHGGPRTPQTVEHPLPLAALGTCVLRAAGGAGGHGGHAGHGGDGGRGSDGRDATASSNGTSGERGGDGGDGGRGSDGGPGGPGGAITVQVASADTWLLMAIESADQPAPLVAGGQGGKAGSHGRGGRGGSGGSGGSSYSHTDSDGHTVSRSGGMSGSSGFSGRTPTEALFDGAPGAPGRFTIEVVDAPLAGRFERRHDLRMAAFVLDETTHGDDRDGIFEFGELVVAEDFDLVNDGGMPSPLSATTVVELLPGRLVDTRGEVVVLGRSLAVHEHALLPGPIHFRIPRPPITESAAPLVLEEDVCLTVTQLGPPATQLGTGTSGFARRFGDRHVRQRLVARFPVENRDHVQALRSLAPGETTRFSFTVHNIARTPLGSRTRPVAIQVQLAGGELGPGDVTLRGPHGKVDLAGTHEGYAGAFYRIDELAPGGAFTLAGDLQLREGLPPYVHARLRFTIWLAELGRERQQQARVVGAAGPDSGLFVAVQHRDLEVRIEPRFRARPDGKVLLCLNDRTTRDAFLAWETLLAGELRLPYDTWSLSREGHFDWRRELADQTTLKVWLVDRVAIVLNQPFHPRASDDTDWPAEYVPAREFREGATYEGTHLLMVGGADVALTELLRPTANARLRGDDFEDTRQLLHKEAKTGGALTQEIFRDDLTLTWDEVQLHAVKFLGRPREAELRASARTLLDALEALYPSRRYVIVYHPTLEGPHLGRRWILWKRWRVGRAEVRRTLDLDTSSAVLLQASEKALANPAFIASPEVRYAVLLSLPFADKVARLFSYLDRGQDETAALCARAILVDLAEEQSALRRGALDLDDGILRERLANLDALAKHDAGLASDGAARVLADLVGGVRALASLQKSWWMWWGRNRRISGHLADRARELAASWGCLPERVADAEARHRGRVAEQVATRGLRRAAACRRYFEQPPELHGQVTRDLDVWLSPDARVWSGDDLAAARQAEAGRVAKQARLYAENQAARLAMTQVPTDEPAATAATAPAAPAAGTGATVDATPEPA